MGKTLSIIREQLIWLFVLGPMLSILPSRWRGRGLNQRFALWGVATIISSVGVFLVGLNLFGLWYAYSLNPAMLWVGAYFICDGVWRVSNARREGQNTGTLLLVALDQMILAAGQTTWKLAHPVVSDIPMLDDTREDWQLKIECARPKRHWAVGKIVRYGERYFRIESSVETKNARTYVYLLRSLPVGVPSHSVLNYIPVEVPQKSG
jgi:hypothetical protein